MLHFRNENVEKSMFYNIQYGNAMFIDTRACIFSVYVWYSVWAIRGLLRFRNFSFESESSFSCNCTGNLYRLRDISLQNLVIEVSNSSPSSCISLVVPHIQKILPVVCVQVSHNILIGISSVCTNNCFLNIFY